MGVPSVTGHTLENVATIISDGTPNQARQLDSGPIAIQIWCSDNMPADISVGLNIEDMGGRLSGTAPPAKGTRFVIVDFPPGNSPFMHRTETLDYAIVLSGKIDMALDSTTIYLSAGDVVVQRGTNHAWANVSQTMSRVAFVLIGAHPIGIGNPIQGAETTS